MRVEPVEAARMSKRANRFQYTAVQFQRYRHFIDERCGVALEINVDVVAIALACGAILRILVTPGILRRNDAAMEIVQIGWVLVCTSVVCSAAVRGSPTLQEILE